MHEITRRLRERRNQRAFDRALREASPAMRQELNAVATRSHIHVA